MSTANADPAALDTFPRLLLHHAAARPAKPAMREKHLGIWQTWSWTQAAEQVRALAAGLAANGFQRGDHLAIIGDNRPRLYWAMCAAQALGGVAVPLYQDAIAQEMVFVMHDADVKFAIAEDQEQVDKLREIKPQCPLLTHIFYDDARGLRHYTDVQSLEALQKEGRAFLQNNPGYLDAEIARGSGADIAVMLYTSGTTGNPKGVCQTHNAFIAAARGDVAFDGFTDQDQILSYLPMAWVGDHLFSYAEALVAGFTVNCPESSDTVMIDLREIGPTYYFAPPRVFENLLTQVTIRMEDAGWLKRKWYKYFMNVARRCGADIMDGRAVSLGDRLLYKLGDALIYGPLRNTLGMSRIRVAYTGGAAIGPDLYRFYRSIGINLKQLYGQTETCAYVSKHANGEVKLDSVGKPLPGVHIKIAANGEVLVKTPSLLKEFRKRPDATAEAIDGDGYFHTGDAGFFDSDGHLKIIDRAKDVGKLNNGTLFAPQFIENKLKFFSHIKEAVAFGDRRDQTCVMINIDMQAVGDWAERRGIPYSGHTDLAARPEVYKLVGDCVERVNSDLAQDAALAGSQVRRFLVLHKELDADDGELTRTRKVRRGYIAEKYAALVEALYAGKPECHIETQVKFEDGRTGTISADVRIADANTFGPGELARAA